MRQPWSLLLAAFAVVLGLERRGEEHQEGSAPVPNGCNGPGSLGFASSMTSMSRASWCVDALRGPKATMRDRAAITRFFDGLDLLGPRAGPARVPDAGPVPRSQRVGQRSLKMHGGLPAAPFVLSNLPRKRR